MKVNLLLDNPGDVRSGHVNVDPLAPDDCRDGRVRGDVADLAHSVDAAEAEAVVALDVLDYFPGAVADVVLGNWLSRLARGGTLTVSVVDVREVARSLLAGNLSLEEVNELLLGKQEKPWQFKKAAFTLSQLAEVLKNLGYQILARRVQNHRAVVTCRRP